MVLLWGSPKSLVPTEMYSLLINPRSFPKLDVRLPPNNSQHIWYCYNLLERNLISTIEEKVHHCYQIVNTRRLPKGQKHCWKLWNRKKKKKKDGCIPLLLSPPPTMNQFSPTVIPACPARGVGISPCCVGLDHSIYAINNPYNIQYI